MVRGTNEEAKGVAPRASTHVGSAIEATFPVRGRVGEMPPIHREIASFSRASRPPLKNSGHDAEPECSNFAEILGMDAIAPHRNDSLKASGSDLIVSQNTPRQQNLWVRFGSGR